MSLTLTASLPPALRPRAVRVWGRVLGLVAAISVLALAVLHGWLLWRRIAQQEIFEPDVALRWLSGLALLGGFAWLRRQGVPLLRGRRALVLWLLVAVLHLGVSATGVEGPVAGLDPITASSRWLAVPFGGGMLLLVLLCPLLLTGLAVSGSALGARRSCFVCILPARSTGFCVQLSSRPPPV